MNKSVVGFQILSMALFLAACGGADGVSTVGDDLPSVSLETSQYIGARGSWQCMSLNVQGGDQLTIKSTGAWTGGQRDRAAAGSSILSTILYTDANGGNGLAYDVNQAVVDAPSFAVLVNPAICVGGEPCNIVGIRSGNYCDATLEATIPTITDAQRCSGTSPLSQLIVTIPGTTDLPATPSQALNIANNRGPLCSPYTRVTSVRYGREAGLVTANECLPITRSRLIGKIIPPTVDPSTIVPMDIGKLYESAPYTVPSSVVAGSKICFRSNDTDAGTGDNHGGLNVSLTRLRSVPTSN